MKKVYRDMMEFATQYKLAALIWAGWSMWIVSFVVYKVFDDITLITLPVTTALATVFGLPAIAVGLIKWRQIKNDADNTDPDS